jgi:hypothetical protein
MASFKEAFRDARAGGGKTFEWNGKSYSTDLAPEASSSGGRSRSSADMPGESSGGRTRASAATHQGAADAAPARDPRISTLTTRGGSGMGHNEGSSVRHLDGSLR